VASSVSSFKNRDSPYFFLGPAIRFQNLFQSYPSNKSSAPAAKVSESLEISEKNYSKTGAASLGSMNPLTNKPLIAFTHSLNFGKKSKN
jgi:hypothetical protein